MNLAPNTKVVRVSNAVAVGTSTVNSTAVDTEGYESVTFIAAFGAITDGAPDVRAQQGNLSDGSDAADLAGTNIIVADADDNKLAVLEIVKPRERYVRCAVVRGGATGSVLDGIVAILASPRKAPAAVDATVSGRKTVVSPVEGPP